MTTGVDSHPANVVRAPWVPGRTLGFEQPIVTKSRTLTIIRTFWLGMVRFAELFPDEEIVNALRSQLSWTHFRELLSLDEQLKRDFYAEMCRVERWSARTLRHKIGHLLYERTAISKKPNELFAQDTTALRDEDRLTPDMVFRDPYFLDFLGLSGHHVDKDVEDAILRELQAFILYLGSDFAFVARQMRITLLPRSSYSCSGDIFRSAAFAASFSASESWSSFFSGKPTT